MAPKLKQSHDSAALTMVAKLVLVVSTAAVTMVSVQTVGVEADIVNIVNDMGPGVMLEVECSTNGGKLDLGHQTIYSGLSYIFEFDPSWWGRDVYTCDFQAPGFPLKRMNVYEGINFFGNFCLCRICHWTVSPLGFDCEHGQYQERWK